jgi:hypothetical protein
MQIRFPQQSGLFSFPILQVPQWLTWDHRQGEERLVTAVVQHDLMRHPNVIFRFISHHFTRIQIPIEAGEVAACDVKPNPMTSLE